MAVRRRQLCATTTTCCAQQRRVREVRRAEEGGGASERSQRWDGETPGAASDEDDLAIAADWIAFLATAEGRLNTGRGITRCAAVGGEAWSAVAVGKTCRGSR